MIIICTQCKGHGKLCYDVGMHKSEYEYETCIECCGSGRLVKTETVLYEPFVPGNSSERIF